MRTFIMARFISKMMCAALTVAGMMTLTSCDDDQETAMMLWGTWEGQISERFYNDRFGSYGSDYYTVWYFEGDAGSRQGRGWEQDYLRGNRYREYFRWYVMDHGNTIELRYYDESIATRYIYRFYINDHHFHGEVDNGDGTYTAFNLYNADDYGYDGYDHYYEWHHWAKPSSTIENAGWQD